MKKIITLLVLAFASIALHAERTVPYNHKTWSDAYKAKDYVAAKASLDSFILDTDGKKLAVASHYVGLTSVSDQAVINTPEKATAYATTLVAECGITDANAIDYVKTYVLVRGGHYRAVCDYVKALPAPSVGTKELLMHSCLKLKKYDEALAYALETNQMYYAAIAAKYQGDKVKIFELSKRAALEGYLTAARLKNVLNYVGEQYFGDTTITEEQQTEFLVAVNQKYSRFLVTDKATWEPILAGVRVTLKARGVNIE